MKPLIRRIFGFTISELLVAATVATVLSAALITGAVVIQKNFIASSRYARNVAQQIRLLDFVSLDLRRALTVTNDSSGLTVTIPDFYDASGKPRTPLVTSGKVSYGNSASPKVVRYYKQGSSVIRSFNGTPETIASDVEDFQLAFKNEGQVVEVSISFIPTFQKTAVKTDARAGTTFFVRTLLRNKLQ
jgi:hypothetical protein